MISYHTILGKEIFYKKSLQGQEAKIDDMDNTNLF